MFAHPYSIVNAMWGASWPIPPTRIRAASPGAATFFLPLWPPPKGHGGGGRDVAAEGPHTKSKRMVTSPHVTHVRARRNLPSASVHKSTAAFVKGTDCVQQLIGKCKLLSMAGYIHQQIEQHIRVWQMRHHTKIVSHSFVAAPRRSPGVGCGQRAAA